MVPATRGRRKTWVACLVWCMALASGWTWPTRTGLRLRPDRLAGAQPARPSHPSGGRRGYAGGYPPYASGAEDPHPGTQGGCQGAKAEGGGRNEDEAVGRLPARPQSSLQQAEEEVPGGPEALAGRAGSSYPARPGSSRQHAASGTERYGAAANGARAGSGHGLGCSDQHSHRAGANGEFPTGCPGSGRARRPSHRTWYVGCNDSAEAPAPGTTGLWSTGGTYRSANGGPYIHGSDGSSRVDALPCGAGFRASICGFARGSTARRPLSYDVQISGSRISGPWTRRPCPPSGQDAHPTRGTDGVSDFPEKIGCQEAASGYPAAGSGSPANGSISSGERCRRSAHYRGSSAFSAGGRSTIRAARDGWHSQWRPDRGRFGPGLTEPLPGPGHGRTVLVASKGLRLALGWSVLSLDAVEHCPFMGLTWAGGDLEPWHELSGCCLGGLGFTLQLVLWAGAFPFGQTLPFPRISSLCFSGALAWRLHWVCADFWAVLPSSSSRALSDHRSCDSDDTPPPQLATCANRQVWCSTALRIDPATKVRSQPHLSREHITCTGQCAFFGCCPCNLLVFSGYPASPVAPGSPSLAERDGFWFAMECQKRSIGGSGASTHRHHQTVVCQQYGDLVVSELGSCLRGCPASPLSGRFSPRLPWRFFGFLAAFRS